MSLPGPSKLKKKHFRVKHQKVKLFRANEPFLSVLMWGINHTVGELGVGDAGPVVNCSVVFRSTS